MDWANVIFLVMLLVFVGSAFFKRGQMSQNVTALVTWSMIFLVLVLGYRAYQRYIFVPKVVEGNVSLKISYDRSQGGYYTLFKGNDVEMGGILDTGATSIILTYHDAKKAGLDTDTLDFSTPISTAGGITRAANATLNSLSFGDQVYYDIPILVAQAEDLETNLLGMTLMHKFEGFAVSDRQLLIEF